MRLDELRKIFLRPTVISVFLLVGFWNITVSSDLFAHGLEGSGGFSETMREIRDVNLHIQLRFYNLLVSSRPMKFKAGKNVTMVYIDDTTHWSRLEGVMPTNRAYLAMLIRRLSIPAKTRAKAIGLDFELLAPPDFPDGTDYPSRASDNADLLAAVHEAAENGVPVVLGGVLAGDHEHTVRLPQLFSKEQLQAAGEGNCAQSPCPEFGYLNIPVDRRVIPLTEDAVSESNPAISERVDSFALSLAKIDQSFRSEWATLPTSGHGNEELFGSFLPEGQYTTFSALQIEQKDKDALARCANTIVLIGGRWHDLEGHGLAVDTHLSPAGTMSGLGLHANYIESLLQGQHARELPLWADIFLDLVAGLIIFGSFEKFTGFWRAMVLVGASVVPILAAWGLLLTLNLYVDLLFPLELYFLHIFYEFCHEYIGATWPSSPKTHPTE